MLHSQPFGTDERCVLERIATGAPLPELLEDIVTLVEHQAGGMLCSILLLDREHKCMRPGAAPSLPPAYTRAIAGLSIGPAAGSCGTAAYRGERVIVEDIASHPFWSDYHQFALPHDLRACWSSPIFSAEREVLGTFAMYYHEPRGPTQQEIEWVDAATHLATIAIVRDQDEQALRRSEARLRQLINTSYEGICTVDSDWRITFANRRLAEMLGYSPPEVFGHSVLDFIEPAMREAVRESLAHWMQGASGQQELRLTHKDGSKVWTLVSGSPMVDEDGNYTGALGMITDISERKAAEQRQREAEHALERAQRMEALGTLAGGIAHDFNNILSAIAAHAELGRMDLDESHPASERFAQIHTGGQRASDLVRQILRFSRREKPHREVLQLPALIEEAVQLLRATLPRNIELRTHFAPDSPTVFADATQMHQIVMNLSTNAVHAIEGHRGHKGRIEMRTEAVSADDVTTPDLPAGQYVHLSISDNGCGMDKATMAHLFEPFFTTRAPGEGTGLGLSVVHGIIKNHDGVVTVESQPGHGTTFHLYFPAVDPDQLQTARDRAALVVTPGQRILYVDDEDTQLLLARRLLERLGYRVTTCTGGSQALAEFRARPEAYDAVITDNAMPGMSGLQLVEELHRLRPEVPVVIASGYLSSDDWQRAEQLGIDEVVLKPQMSAELGPALQRAMHPGLQEQPARTQQPAGATSD